MLSLLTLVFACGRPADLATDATPESAADAPTIGLSSAPLVREPLPPAALLRRASVDLRGTTPTLAELERLAAGPDAYDAIVAEMLVDPRTEDRFADLFAERWLLRQDALMLQHGYFGLTDTQEYRFERAVEDEPARLAARIVSEDLPWTELVQADWTMATPLLATVLPVEMTEETDGWGRATYLDDRPAIGVVATSGLWSRYSTTPGNLNRSRAAGLTRMLLCADYLTRPVSFSSLDSLDDVDDLEDAVSTNPTCTACHSTLDPLSSALFGFWPYDRADPYELTTYHHEREGLGQWYLGAFPAWFGTPLYTTADLGPAIAADPRFRDCGLQTFAEMLLRRPLTGDDDATMQQLRDTWTDTDARPHAIVRAVLASEEWRVGAVSGGTSSQRSAEPTRRVMSPTQLATAVEELTGFRWNWEGFDQLDNDDYGYRVLAGGVDGDQITAEQSVPTVATVAVIRALAASAADAVVTHDLSEFPESPTLLDLADLDTRPQDDAFDRQLDALYLRLYARLPTDQERADDASLWTDVHALTTSRDAWRALISTLIRDPAFWTY